MNKNRPNPKWITWAKALAFGLAIILTVAVLPGCGSSPMTSKAPLPVKPKIDVMVLPDGGMCLDRENAEKLGAYIINLERAAKY